MTEIRIEYNDTQVQAALNRLLHASRDMSPAMRVIAGHLKAGAQKAFLTETAPDGTKWPGLSDTTKKRRQKSGHTPIKILQQSGDLAGSITADSDATSAVAGTNLVYATTHQFGAKKGEFGSYILQRAIGGRRLQGPLATLSARQGGAKSVPIPGSSPRLRGTQRTQQRDTLYVRFIPASAGNTRR